MYTIWWWWWSPICKHTNEFLLAYYWQYCHIKMVIRPLDDRTYCALTAITHLGLWRRLYGCSLQHFTTNQRILKCALIHIFVNLQPSDFVLWRQEQAYLNLDSFKLSSIQFYIFNIFILVCITNDEGFSDDGMFSIERNHPISDGCIDHAVGINCDVSEITNMASNTTRQ